MRQALLKKSRCLLVLTFFFTAVVGAFAQTVTITGKVTDEKKEGLPGVTVLLKGTSTANATDIDGNYSLAVPSGAGTLVFSYIGFVTQEVPINGRTTINVALTTDAKAIEEVVVVGYQTVTRKELTSSVSSVNAKQLQDVPVSTAAEALAGRLAGVQVNTSEGQPGAEITIRVRGGNSITQSNEPLYIVDGIQVENALSFISPQEIQTIDVLKDAASTAIYGARGSNGVVVITTKGGREMPTQVTYNGFAGVRQIVNKLPVMSPYDFVQYQYQVYNYNQNEEVRNSFRDRYGRFEDLDIYRNMPATDWQEEVFGRAALSQTHVVAVTGGSKVTSFNFTLNHVDEEGIMLNSGNTRTLASLKFDHSINDRVKVGFSTRYSRQQIEGVGTSSTGTQSTNRLRNSVRFRPFVAPGFEDQVDEFDPNYFALTNLTSPVLLANQELRYDRRNDLIFNGYGTIELIKNLSFKSVFGINTTDRRVNEFNGVVTAVARQNNAQPVVNQNSREQYAITNSNTLNYRTNFGEDHGVNVLLGQEIWKRAGYVGGVQVRWLPIDITPDQAFSNIQSATPPAGLIQSPATTGEFGASLFSLFGSVGYNYKEKYRLNVAFRRDASSLFAPERNSGFFPTMSLAWHIGDEAFMAGTKSWLNDLKFRFGFGAVGNNGIDADQWRTTFGTTTNDGYAYTEAVTPGLVPPVLANRFLQWETTVSKNLALDFSLWNSRLNGSIDFYENSSKQLLLLAQIPSTSGYPTQQQNVGSTRNRGIELQLDGVIIDKGDLTWTSNFNITTQKNRIVSLGIDTKGQPLKSYTVSSGWITSSYQDFLVEVGGPVGQYFGYETDGFYTLDDFTTTFNPTTNVYTYVLKEGVANSQNIALGNRVPQPGDLKLKDLTPDNGTSLIGLDDRKVLGNNQPKFFGGLNQQVTYKGFDMSLFMNFSVGAKVYNANRLEFTTLYEQRDNNMLTLMNDRWKWYDNNGALVTDPKVLAEMNKDTKYWTPGRGQYFLHSFGIEDGSFLRISNLTLGYTLPETLVKRTRVISKLRVYGTVNNLATITGYSGYDPEANTRRSALTPGVDYAAYPRSRYVVGGVNITF
ncbi:SusC/RagA family TonB-linked outer membrane protein [Rufibacter glacialis]|uniref:SusC/RagA family TonB-linked outer membrane protein n=1 Tax=Rufibacter glacialis TaxID=1259555 RepID=A0A5M8Q457_9BACT|nr:TonB-dependent receptor [Rufibacter glacialis]KAA6430665.1 TonB-dependent receptor [Rufibacter glacialis]GGK85603.1 SusC/RagA family TonB-linked outer membrane protein [Rufibacter glacialis]